MWDFWSLSPGKPAPGDDPDVGPRPADQRRHMNGYGIHTYSLHQRGRRALLGEVPLQDPAGPSRTGPTPRPTTVIGKTRESYQEDLLRRDRARRLPEMDACRSRSCRSARRTRPRYNPFDLTKVWPHGDYPLIDVGVMELNRNPENYFAEIEQAAFSPSNIVPGIGFSPGQDAAGAHLLLRRRASLPARHALRGAAGQCAASARCITTTRTARCGSSATTPATPTPITSRTRFDGPKRGQAASRSRRCGSPATRPATTTAIGNDDYGQPRALFNLFDAGQKARLFSNIAAAMGGVPDEIVERQLPAFRPDPPRLWRGRARGGRGRQERRPAEVDLGHRRDLRSTRSSDGFPRAAVTERRSRADYLPPETSVPEER